MFHYFERTNNVGFYYAGQASFLLRWALVPFWIVMPLAVTGLVVTWSDRRDLVWLYIALLVPLITILMFYQTARFRLPIIVGMIPLAAATLDRVFARRGNVAAILVMTIVLGVACRLPSSSDPAYVQERDFAAGADVLKQIGQYDAAVEQGRQAVERFPDSPGARMLVIDALRTAGRTEQAVTACKQAVRDFPENPRVRSRRAALYVDQKRPDRAVELYRAILRTAPRSVTARIGMARALLASGPSRDPTKAARFAAQAAKLSPNHSEVYRVWAEALAADDETKRAIRILEASLANTAPTDRRRAEMETLRGTFK
jgi:predicted Zn-dependent protease